MIVCRQCRQTSRALDLCNRFFPFNLGMIAPGNHWDFDSLRAAPPARYRSMRTCSSVDGDCHARKENWPAMTRLLHFLYLKAPSRHVPEGGRVFSKATPHNCVSGSQRIFCTGSTVSKMGNTYSIPAFLKRKNRHKISR